MAVEVYQLTEEEHGNYREAFIREQLVHAGGYYELADAKQILRDFTLLTHKLLEEYGIEADDDYSIDVHTGAIVVDL